MANETLFYCTLEVGVPLAIAEYERSGCPSEWDREQARLFAAELGSKGDQLLYGDKETASMMTKFIRALAVLSFCPGGVRFGELHWEGTA